MMGLAAALEHNTALHTLFLCNNAIGDSGAKTLATGLGRNNTLKDLFLNCNSIAVSGLGALAYAVQSSAAVQTLSVR